VKSTTRRCAAGIAGIVFAGLLLTACGTHPGAAAVVDGRTISQDYLDRTYDEIGNPNLDKPTTLVLLIVAPYFIEGAADEGVGVSEADARAGALAGLGVPEVSDGTVEFFRMTKAWQNLTNQPGGPDLVNEILAEALAKDIEINPRYGELNLQTRLIAQTAAPWIVQG
jgi:hypothetical protein